MEHSVRRSAESNHRQAAYRVHFQVRPSLFRLATTFLKQPSSPPPLSQGWKASWDREVTEEMLLEDTPFNRELMFRIDEITRRTRRIEEVRDRIDRVLTHVTRLRSSGKLANPTDEEAFDWDQVEGILPPPPQPDGRGRGRAAGRKVRPRRGEGDLLLCRTARKAQDGYA